MSYYLSSRAFDAVMSAIFGLQKESAFRVLLERAQIRPGERVLDAGCGTGWLTHRIGARVGLEGRAVGLDPTESALEYARSVARENEEFVQGRMEAIPMPDASFDCVVTSLTLHHVNENLHEQAFAEFGRVVRPGGRLFIIEIAKPETPLPHLLFGWHGCVKASFTKDEMSAHAERAGFGNIEMGTIRGWVRWMRAVRL